MKQFIALFIIILFNSCKKEEMTLYTATLKNNTTHQITIYPYKNGVVNSSDTINLPPNMEFEIADGYFRGIVTGPGFGSNYFGGPNDSIVVYFDSQFRMTHYADQPQNVASNFYPFTSTRNLGNPLSYTFQSVSESNHRQRNMHLYTFVEQDYLDAQ
ncbi:MAG: hypothetical protein QY315_04740 [Saprospiraceae bacterium]|nr:MAG: hypothetical protein QY315_04740 [Saprospiraceae bacterium]